MKGINQKQAVAILPDFCRKLKKVPKVAGVPKVGIEPLKPLKPIKSLEPLNFSYAKDLFDPVASCFRNFSCF